MNFRDTLFVNSEGKLVIGGVTATELTRQFGTPLYVYDGAQVRAMCRAFNEGLKSYAGGGEIKYASKAFSCKEIYRVVKSEGLGCDVVSGGELYTALKAGMPAADIYFHGNNKTRKELSEAVAAGVGAVVIDAFDEIDILDEICVQSGRAQKVLLRLNAEIAVNTHGHVQTAVRGGKFGFALSDGSAEAAAIKTLSKKHLDLWGFSCHLGSQFFETEPFYLSAGRLLDFCVHLRGKCGFAVRELNLGGGFGVWYTEENPVKKPANYTAQITDICAYVTKQASIRALNAPRLVFEPGRSVVAEAGVTLYTVGAVKEIAGIKKYVCVDGGMFENPRHALYEAKYKAILAERGHENAVEAVDIAGKCCESGDIIAAGVRLPKAARGDILAVLSTGAYNYSMASHYNRNFIPPVVWVEDSTAKYIVKPEGYEDLVKNDI